MIAFTIIDYIVFAIFAINVLYVLLFAILSLLKVDTPKGGKNGITRRMAVLIPAYKEDSVIIECARSAIAQRYPRDKYDVVVISDSMTDETNQRLSQLDLKLVVVNFDKSTKVKSLRKAMQEIGDNYDVAVILDADNVVRPSFLTEINDAFEAGYHAVQAHRTAKNMNTDVAVLDALSEEINNSIFRKGQAVIGQSASLIGSGMAFTYKLLKDLLDDINAVGGFDRLIDLILAYHRITVGYLPNTMVLDEKVQSAKTFSNQRRRWLSAQLVYFKMFTRHALPQLFKGNMLFCNKLFQNMMIPRLILFGAILIIAIVLSFVYLPAAVKWWVALATALAAYMIATPRRLYTKQLMRALFKLPLLFVLFVGNFFKLRNANNTFIHTPHGIENSNKK